MRSKRAQRARVAPSTPRVRLGSTMPSPASRVSSLASRIASLVPVWRLTAAVAAAIRIIATRPATANCATGS